MSNKIIGPLGILVFMAFCIGVGIATSDRPEFSANAARVAPVAPAVTSAETPVATTIVVTDGITYMYHVTLLKQPNDSALVRCVTMRATATDGQTFPPVMNCR